MRLVWLVGVVWLFVDMYGIFGVALEEEFVFGEEGKYLSGRWAGLYTQEKTLLIQDRM